MRPFPRLWMAAVAVAGCALACSSSPDGPTAPEVPGHETSQFVHALRGLGATAEVIEVLPASANPDFKAPSVRLRLNGADVWVYEYATTAEADEAASRVPYLISVSLYISAPHFFRGDRLIVLYVGLDTAVSSPVERLLGPPFAG